MIIEPVNDQQCLSQLTTIARELAPTTLVRTVAQRLGSERSVVEWLQSLPQTDDRGDELVRYISCDVPQRVRLFPDDPNCVERALAAAMLLEELEPDRVRALATVDKPLRHTGLVERRGRRWHAVDLFPRRNAGWVRNVDWEKLGGDALQGIHNYVGKPVLKFYLGETGGKVADAIGEQEDKALGRAKQPAKRATPRTVSEARARVVRGDEKPSKSEAGRGFDEENHGGKESNEEQSALARRDADCACKSARRKTAQADARNGDRAHDKGAKSKRRPWWFVEQ